VRIALIVAAILVIAIVFIAIYEIVSTHWTQIVNAFVATISNFAQSIVAVFNQIRNWCLEAVGAETKTLLDGSGIELYPAYAADIAKAVSKATPGTYIVMDEINNREEPWYICPVPFTHDMIIDLGIYYIGLSSWTLVQVDAYTTMLDGITLNGVRVDYFNIYDNVAYGFSHYHPLYNGKQIGHIHCFFGQLCYGNQPRPVVPTC
jgi:hypothetical protein